MGKQCRQHIASGTHKHSRDQFVLNIALRDMSHCSRCMTSAPGELARGKANLNPEELFAFLPVGADGPGFSVGSRNASMLRFTTSSTAASPFTCQSFIEGRAGDGEGHLTEGRLGCT